MEEEWFSLEDIKLVENNSEKLYCIAVDSPEKQFLAGKIAFPTHNTDEGKEDDALKGEAAMIIGSIARLGRAAGVHLVIATQRPDATILAGELKANLAVRINCGRTDSNASSMILGSSEGTRVKANPPGRLYLSLNANGDHGQGFFAPQEWIDEYLESQGLNPDGSPIASNSKQSSLAHLEDLSKLEGDTLDAREGIDNYSRIEKLREAEESSDDDNENNGLIENDSNVEDLDMDDLNSFFEDDNDLNMGEDENSEEDSDDNNSSSSEMKAPILGAKSKTNQWSKPEEDWSPELEDLIKLNRS